MRRISSWLLNSFMQSYWKEIEDCKVKVFDKLAPESEKVLEIGIGTGPNMRYYAAHNINLTLYGLDPNRKMKKYSQKSAAKAGLKPKHFRFKQGVGEVIPLDDASMDAVVSTFVLCSVSDVTQTLNEIKRVLRPGGSFIFLEHVAAEEMAEHSAGYGNDVDWNTDDEIDNFQSSPSSSLHPPCRNLGPKGISDETVARFYEMGFPVEMIAKAIEETGGENSELILETLFKYSTNSEASSSRSKVIDHLIGMGFSEESTMKAMREYGEENVDEITNALLSYAEAYKLQETENEDIENDDTDLYSGLISSDEELNSSHEDDILQALIKMDFPRDEASIAIERCGENANIAELVDFITAAQMTREFDHFYADHDEVEPRNYSKKRRVYNETPTMANIDHNLIRLPNPMIGFGVPNEPGLVTQRPVPIPKVAYGPPYFYYENVAMATKGDWLKISSYLYGIIPEFVDSKYFCPANRKRGYIHNLPIKNRFMIQPPQHRTIQKAFPWANRWWPSWDKRTQLNCLLTSKGSAQLTKRIRVTLEKYNGKPPLLVQKDVLDECKRWNLVWVGKNKAATLDPNEMEQILGFPRDHTRGGGVTGTDRYKCLGNSFQVDTVAYHLSVLKPIFPKGIKVLSLFTGIGGAEVALHRLQIPMNVVVSVEISEANRIILRSFWEQTNQKGILRDEFVDVKKLNYHTIEQLMEEYGAFDLVIGGSPCNNIAGCNRVSRNGLDGEHSSLFFDYCRILEDVRHIAARMN